MEPRLAVDGDLRPFAEYVTKHEGRTARFAGVLHLVEHSSAEAVDADGMARAIRIGEYFLAHTLRARVQGTRPRAGRWRGSNPATTTS
jgi:hypothetical protein